MVPIDRQSNPDGARRPTDARSLASSVVVPFCFGESGLSVKQYSYDRSVLGTPSAEQRYCKDFSRMTPIGFLNAEEVGCKQRARCCESSSFFARHACRVDKSMQEEERAVLVSSGHGKINAHLQD